MQFSFFDVIVLVGVIQGAITSAILFFHKPPARNPVLPWLILVTALLNGKILLHTLGIWNTPVFRYFPLALDLVIQPLLYLYVISITQAQRASGRLTRVHLLLPALFMVHALFVYSQVLPIVDLEGKARMAARFYYNQVKEGEDYLSVLSFFFYIGLSIRQLRSYRRWLSDEISDASYPSYTWLRNLLLLMGGLTGLLLINLVLDYGFNYGQSSMRHWQFFYFVLTGLIYYISYQATRQPLLPRQPMVVATSRPEPLELVSQQKLETLQASILHLLEEEKMYRNPTLTVTEVARQLQVPANVISYSVSKSFGKPFRDLINEYRVEEVKTNLSNPKLAHLSILGIALDAGFNSEASFYRVFKKLTNHSPKDYQIQQR